jgi:hypothetical protein
MIRFVEASRPSKNCNCGNADKGNNGRKRITGAKRTDWTFSINDPSSNRRSVPNNQETYAKGEQIWDGKSQYQRIANELKIEWRHGMMVAKRKKIYIDSSTAALCSSNFSGIP